MEDLIDEVVDDMELCGGDIVTRNGKAITASHVTPSREQIARFHIIFVPKSFTLTACSISQASLYRICIFCVLDS
jgi:hypothetical protein